jgi:ABC-type bacteriocin/lantibiotic exporter with double-glycine peptidase domain
MSDLTPSGGGRLSRRTREQRAFRLVVAGGIAGTVALVTFVLALVGVIGYGLFVIAIIVTVACVLMFRRTVSR